MGVQQMSEGGWRLKTLTIGNDQEEENKSRELDYRRTSEPNDSEVSPWESEGSEGLARDASWYHEP